MSKGICVRVTLYTHLKQSEIKRPQRDQLATTHRDIVLTRIFFSRSRNRPGALMARHNRGFVASNQALNVKESMNKSRARL